MHHPAHSPPPAIYPPRRRFLQTSAVLAAGAALRAVRPLSAAVHRRAPGANDRIHLGIIGCGNRGRTAHMPGIHQHLAAANFEIVALADPWKKARALANAKVKEWFGREAREFVSYPCARRHLGRIPPSARGPVSDRFYLRG